MKSNSLANRTSNQLLVESATFSAMAAKAHTREAQRALAQLSERYRELAARRAALACLAANDPAATMLQAKIQRLIREMQS